jgi:hypothetical protein
MPNTQTSVPAFTAGQVLTAAQMTEVNTGIPVFATTTTRDAAFGGTGEKTLSEGQFAYIEATNTTQYYDGAAWQTLVVGGLTYITGASFTAAATVSMASGVFSATYNNYVVMLNLTASSADQVFAWRVNNAGSPRTAANYYGATNLTNAAGTASTVGSSAATSFGVGNVRNTIPFASYTISVYSPADAATKTTLGFYGFGYTALNAAATANGGMIYDVAEANDGLTFFVTGTITGSYKVYGLANS